MTATDDDRRLDGGGELVQANFQLPKAQITWLREQSFKRTTESGKRVSQAEIVRQALEAAGAPAR